MWGTPQKFDHFYNPTNINTSTTTPKRFDNYKS
jgi:hypothetical protein